MENDSMINYRKITEILLKLGVKPKMSGFEYLRDATVLQYENSEMKLMDIYKKVAEKHNAKPGSVEKNIRNAITAAFNVGGLLTINEFYNTVMYDNTEKYTNLELITLICEIINFYNTQNLIKTYEEQE